jgi:ABC-type multidrug transport system ATPase subunit
MMLTLIKPDSGSVKFFGKSIGGYDRSMYQRIGALVERPDFYLYLSAYRNLEFFAGISGVHVTKKEIYAMLDRVGLGGREKDKVKNYSLGMKQRLGIAQALIHDPDLIILDEPTNGLDPKGMREVKDLLNDLSDSGKTVFVSSHILREVEVLASSMAIINRGKTIVQGNVKEFLDESVANIHVEVQKSFDPVAKDFNGYDLVSHKTGELVFNTKKKEIPELLHFLHEHDAEIYSVSAVNSLEDYFLSLTEGNS